MKFYFGIAAACLMASGLVQAQERTATGTVDTQMTWSALKTMVDNASTKSDAVNARVDQIVLCAKKGMLYAPGLDSADAQGCAGAAMSAVSSSMVVKIMASSGVNPGNGRYASYAKAVCPAGTVLIACMGSRNPNFKDTCDEGDCGLVGAGPLNDTTCITTVDDDSGTRATAWATCMKAN